MKQKLTNIKFYLTSFLFAVFLLSSNQSKSQVSIRASFGPNIVTQPMWGPVGYERADYYYLPDFDLYYDVRTGNYIYLSGNRWVTSPNLPYAYQNIDLYNTYKVVINGNKPYLNHRRHVTIYSKYRGRHDQPVIRDSRDKRYWENRNHPSHDRWRRDKDRNDRRY